jgi:hypothetical protein
MLAYVNLVQRRDGNWDATSSPIRNGTWSDVLNQYNIRSISRSIICLHTVGPARSMSMDC